MNTDRIADTLDPVGNTIRRLAPGGRFDFRGSVRVDRGGICKWMKYDKASGLYAVVSRLADPEWYAAV